MAFDLMSIMNQKSKDTANKPKYERKRISIDLLYPNPENSKIYSVEKIEELADAIELTGGVLHNLVVRAENDEGKYQIISGERRWRALQMLVRERHQNAYYHVDCLVENEHDEDMLNYMLIATNSTTRELTDAEKMRQSQKLMEILRKMQAAGKVQGRIRDIVAKTLNMSSAQVARYQAIANNTKSDTLKEAFDNGKVGVSVAYEASGLSEDGQKEVAAIVEEHGKASLDQVKEVKERERAAEEAKKPVQVELSAMPAEPNPLSNSERVKQEIINAKWHQAQDEEKAAERVNKILQKALDELNKEPPSNAAYTATNRLMALMSEIKDETVKRLQEVKQEAEY